MPKAEHQKSKNTEKIYIVNITESKKIQLKAIYKRPCSRKNTAILDHKVIQNG